MKPEEVATAIAGLEKRIGQLERRVDDYSLKSQILGDITPSFESGIDRFFAEPEFWENTYDASQVECSRRCSEAYKEHLAACEDVAGVTAREQCRTEARLAVIACHAACA